MKSSSFLLLSSLLSSSFHINTEDLEICFFLFYVEPKTISVFRVRHCWSPNQQKLASIHCMIYIQIIYIYIIWTMDKISVREISISCLWILNTMERSTRIQYKCRKVDPWVHTIVWPRYPLVNCHIDQGLC